MPEFLVIRIGAGQAELANWIVIDASGGRRSPPVTGALAEAVQDIGDRKVIVLVPSAEVLTTTVDVPIKGGARLQAALPYALEEFVAEDVDKLHFAAGARRSNGRVPVSVVSRDTLRAWMSLLDDAGINPSSIIAESYGLARIPGTISMLVAEDQVVINNGRATRRSSRRTITMISSSARWPYRVRSRITSAGPGRPISSTGARTTTSIARRLRSR
jgi:general secretion pathway protein L